MSKNYPEITSRLSKELAALGKASPETLKGFQSLIDTTNGDGVLDNKTKELIALAIGITQHCDGCIGFHTKKFKALGGTSQELSEMLNVCIYMGGGPALMYAADAFEAYQQY
ncbi:carboxymuconolactone decarboxylase family protein [Celerinatantimonas sp. YJH-8]|uniref:carboxymuconolactone decarboxylase family protein n=1 Tax=Celerinatantimonas sp. YJH-8 TaxID=3228714 RepID=UPI0038C88C76